MADESGFSFITVGAAEEEDVVIQAGIVEDAVAEPQVEAVQPEEAADFEDAVETIAVEPAPMPAPAPAPKQGRQAKQEKLEAAFGSKTPAPAAQKAVKAAPAAKPANDFEQTTTLADLEANEPMPAVRMAMIGVALIALVAFLVYFNFFM